MDLVPQIGLQPLWPVNPQLAVNADVAKQRLEAPGLMRFAGQFGGTAVELLQDETILIGPDIVIAKQPPGQRDHVGIGDRREQVGQAAGTHLDIDEFIDIHADRPARALDHRFRLCRLQRRVLRFHVHAAERIVAVLDQPLGLQQVQHRVGAIAAIVGIDQEIIDPDGAVIGQPFQHERPFVLHGGDDGDTPAGRRCLWCRPWGTDRVVAQLVGKRQQGGIFDQAGLGHQNRAGMAGVADRHAAIKRRGLCRVGFGIGNATLTPGRIQPGNLGGGAPAQGG